MNKYHVFHRTPYVPRINTDDIQCLDDDYVHVAILHCPSIDKAFELTNSIDFAWWNNVEIEWYKEPTRSTSVGDVIVCDGGRFTGAFIVESVGFRKLKQKEVINCERLEKADNR